MASAMDRIFSSMSNAANKVLGGGVTPNPDPSIGNNTIPGAGNNVHSDGTVKAIPAEAKGDQSPLANYSDLFKDDPDKPALGIPSPMPNFSLDQAKLAAAANSIDFTKDISAEEVAAVFPGVPEAQARTVLNKMGAQNFAATYGAGTGAMEAAMSRQSKDLQEKTIPEIIRREQATMMTRDLGYAKDPMTAPVFAMLKDQFTNKNPDATPAQIADHTQKYMAKMFEAGVGISGKKIVEQPKQRQSDTNWDDFVQDDFGPGAIFN